MFDVSFTELLVIGVVALVVIGPERLPKVARTLGHLVGRAQRYVNDVKSDIKREVEFDELRKLKDQMQDAAQTVQSGLQNTESSLSQPLASLEKDVSELKDALTQSTVTESVAPELSIPAPIATDSASASAQVAAATPASASVQAEVKETLIPSSPMPIPTQLEIDSLSLAATEHATVPATSVTATTAGPKA